MCAHDCFFVSLFRHHQDLSVCACMRACVCACVRVSVRVCVDGVCIDQSHVRQEFEFLDFVNFGVVAFLVETATYIHTHLCIHTYICMHTCTHIKQIALRNRCRSAQTHHDPPPPTALLPNSVRPLRCDDP